MTTAATETRAAKVHTATAVCAGDPIAAEPKGDQPGAQTATATAIASNAAVGIRSPVTSVTRTAAEQS